jgi:hypothetical protein
MTRAEALRRIRRLAGDSANVVFTDHAKTRMRQRRVTPLEVLEVLRKRRDNRGSGARPERVLALHHAAVCSR